MPNLENRGIITAYFKHRGDSLSEGSIFNIMKYAIHDGPGIRTTVFLKGCPLNCAWCHNPESILGQPEPRFSPKRCIGCRDCGLVCPNGLNVELCAGCGKCAQICPTTAREIVGQTISAESVADEIRKDMVFYQNSGGGVTFSGGEPFYQPKFLGELLRLCRSEGIHTAVDTSGYVSREKLLVLCRHIDLFLYDLKILDEKKHIEYTGVSNRLILENLNALNAQNANIWARIPVIPGINDDEAQIHEMGKLISGMDSVLRVNLLPYHDISADKYARQEKEYALSGVRPPDDKKMEDLKKIMLMYKRNVEIGG